MLTYDLELLYTELRLPDGAKVHTESDGSTWIGLTPKQDEQLRRRVVTSALGRMPTPEEAKLLRIKYIGGQHA